MLGGRQGKTAMGKTTVKPPRPTALEAEEDPVWGNSLVDFFGIGRTETQPEAPPATADKPAPKKPARKRPKAG